MTYFPRLITGLALLALGGCYAPLLSPGVPARSLPEEFRTPTKSLNQELNYATLTRDLPSAYVLGPSDLIKVEIADLFPPNRQRPRGNAQRPQGSTSEVVETKIDDQGTILLPLVGSVRIGGLTLLQARQQVVEAYAKEVLDDPRVAITLVQKSIIRVMVLGSVTRPGVYELPRFENDVAHAITAAGGLIEKTADEIQVHRRSVAGVDIPNRSSCPTPWLQASTTRAVDIQQVENRNLSAKTQPARLGVPTTSPAPQEVAQKPKQHPTANHHRPHSTTPVVQQPQPGQRPFRPQLSVLRIPLRSPVPVQVTPDQVTLSEGDVVVVRKYPDEVFFVVGLLSPNANTRFTVGRENRDIGNGFVLPKDRDVDVVTAVAMAGYIDPIDSPTTVTVHRIGPGGRPLLIRVDLIAARFDRKENIMVRPGDIIYLNPDAAWWFRRTFDRVVPTLIESPYTELMERLINPRGFD
ncbi:MAG: polysaccharide biosynthesis/export family protein [Gemmataceae bacterium]